jgi:hypothetical protein
MVVSSVDFYQWVETMAPGDLPRGPFRFSVGTDDRRHECNITITNPAKWLLSLQTDARRGDEHPRARYGALQEDLRRLYELCN